MAKSLMSPSLIDGKIIYVPCEINPGMASNEREITIRNPEGPIRAYVSLTSVATDSADLARKVEGWVKAVIMAFDKNDLRLLFTGQDVYPANPAPVSRQWLQNNAKSEVGFNDSRESRTS